VDQPGSSCDLRKQNPKSLRALILGQLTPQPLIVADDVWASPSIDAEVGHLLLLPTGAVAQGEAVVAVADLPVGRLFEAKRPGLSRLACPGNGWAAFGRVARKTISVARNSATLRRKSMTKAHRLENNAPLLIEGRSVSEAYAKLLLHILAGPGTRSRRSCSPSTASRMGMTFPNMPGVRSELDALLAAKGKARSMTVALHDFSAAVLDDGAGRPRHALPILQMAYPFFRKRNRQANGRGLYSSG